MKKKYISPATKVVNIEVACMLPFSLPIVPEDNVEVGSRRMRYDYDEDDDEEEDW